MLPAYDKPIIQHVVEETVASGIEDIIIVTPDMKNHENHFDKHYELEYNLQKAGKDSELRQIRKITDLADICYVRQKEQNGLGDAIRCGRRHIGDEPFAVLLGDSLASADTKQLIDVYSTYNASAIFTRGGSIDKVERYEITIREQ